MPRNGSGVYSPPAADVPVVSNTLIESAKYNDLISDIATALTASLAADGQTTVTADLPMASHKLTGLSAGSAAGHSVRYEQLAESFPISCIELRLTLTSGTPVTPSDVTAAGTIYLTPYKGMKIALYSGTAWVVRTTAQVSIALSGESTTAPTDIFAYDNAGTVTLEKLAWSNATTRATDLAGQDGILVKSGAPTRRYIGTFMATAAGLTEDSEAKRFLWNYYHRIRKSLKPATETTDSWIYTTATIRQANANTLNQLNFVIGVSEDIVTARIHAACLNSTGSVGVAVGVGLDDTTTFDTHGIFYGGFASPANSYITPTAFWSGYSGIGKHFLSWNEWSAATGTTTWLGDAGSATITQSGIQGDLLC